MARLNLKLAEKDLSIKGLHEQLERGEAAEHLKNIKAEVEMCQREKEVERNARRQLEKNLNQLNTTFMVLRQAKFETREDMVLMQVEEITNVKGLCKYYVILKICNTVIFLPKIENNPPKRVVFFFS